MKVLLTLFQFLVSKPGRALIDKLLNRKKKITRKTPADVKENTRKFERLNK